MTETCVDLSNLRDAIGGDKEIELVLFEEFITSSQSCIAKLNAHCSGDNDNETWRQETHALKGISHNLGAAPLGDLAAKGQDIFEQDPETKKSLLTEIETEHKNVLTFLETQR